MRSALPLACLAFSCAARGPLDWAAPADAAPQRCQQAAPQELADAFAAGVQLTGSHTAALFPDLQLQVSWVARGELRSAQVELCDGQVLLQDLQLRFYNRRGEQLDVALCTEVMVHPRMIMALRRDELMVSPPDGSWYAPDRRTLVRVGAVGVGSLAETKAAPESGGQEAR